MVNNKQLINISNNNIWGNNMPRFVTTTRHQRLLDQNFLDH